MYRFEVDEERRLVVATFTGTVTDEELFSYLSEMLASTSYGAGWHSCIDFTNVGPVHLTRAGVEQMRALPAEMELRLHGARAVIVAEPGSAAFGMARMYEMLGDNVPYKIAVLGDHEEAMAWLFARG
jgi:hypothetical protein